MPCATSRRRRPVALALALTIVVASCAWRVAPTARAAEGEPPPPPQVDRDGLWQGASWGFELRGGASFRATDDSITPAPLAGLGFRVCTLLTLIDLEAFATTAAFTRGSSGADYALRRTTLGIDMRLHPLFIRHLQGGVGDRVLGGLHLALGGAIDLLAIEGPGYDRTDPAFAIAIGLGTDVPLTEPNRRAWSLWLGVGWRMRFVGFPKSAPGLRDMDEHHLLLSLGLRFHDLTGIHLAVPPELDDVDR